MRRQLAQLEEFHETFKVWLAYQPTLDVPEDVLAMRVKLMQEELDEYRQAIQGGDLVDVADALSDLLYVLLGTYIAHGLQDVAEALFDEVHRSNMSKLDSNGRPIYRADGKVLKSNLWSSPALAAILGRHNDGDTEPMTS